MEENQDGFKQGDVFMVSVAFDQLALLMTETLHHEGHLPFNQSLQIDWAEVDLSERCIDLKTSVQEEQVN